MIVKDYYKILQLEPGAGEDAIKLAYRTLAKQFHPDVNKSPEAHEKFCEISEAYEFLINHWPGYLQNQKGRTNDEQRSAEYQQTAAYEKFAQEARERAKRQAHMRYEKFRKQHEAFQESGLNDLALLFTIITRFFGLILFMLLVFVPIGLAIALNWSWIFLLIFTWPFALGLGWYIRDNRRNYFQPGKFYYSFDRIRHMFRDRHPTHVSCYYCSYKMADSLPYKIELLKLKDIKLKTEGFRQHNVNYVNRNLVVSIPRSHKAFIVHTAGMIIKVVAIVLSILFLDISSIVWKIIAGMIAGGILSRIVFTLFRTKSNVSFLFSPELILRIALWLLAIILASRFYFKPFDVNTTDSIHFVIVALVLFDSFIMQLIGMVLGNTSSLPLFRQYPEIKNKMKEGYVAYNDIPAISFLYPILKWIFG